MNKTFGVETYASKTDESNQIMRAQGDIAPNYVNGGISVDELPEIDCHASAGGVQNQDIISILNNKLLLVLNRYCLSLFDIIRIERLPSSLNGREFDFGIFADCWTLYVDVDRDKLSWLYKDGIKYYVGEE